MKTVVIVGMLEAYELDTQGADVWGVNRTFRHQDNLDRVYFLDDPKHFDEDFTKDLNTLNIPVYCQKHYPEIKESREYPLYKIMREFGVRYFTSTTAYMIAHAVLEGYGKIILHSFLNLPHSHDYMDQKPCLDFWMGIAAGRGIEIEISGNSSVCRPFPWQSNLYGYEDPRPEIRMFMEAGMNLNIEYKNTLIPGRLNDVSLV